MAHMALIRFYRHRFFRVIADLTVRLTELAENASTSFWPLHLQDAINLKMVKINVDQHQIVHLMLDLQLDSQKLAHPTVEASPLVGHAASFSKTLKYGNMIFKYLPRFEIEIHLFEGQGSHNCG